MKSPVVLVIIDGFGLSPLPDGNAINQARTPFVDWATASVPRASLHASGAEVGLDWGEMGNSEVGHLNIGTGRIIMQDLPRIDRSIDDGTFFENAMLLEAVEVVRSKKSTLHIIGLASEGGVHAHIRHMIALLEFAKRQKIEQVALHLISDGRDTPAKQLVKDLPSLTTAIKRTGRGVIASVSGRYFAMDRDRRWDRTEKAYQAIRNGKGRVATSVEDALAQAEKAKESDEFITPTVIVDDQGKPLAPILENDVVICTNFRQDRARQLASTLTMTEFTEFPRHEAPVKLFVSFTSYGQEASSQVKVAFFEPPLDHQLAQVVAEGKLHQFHVAETEKYAHVTYFLNGGQEQAFSGEERTLVPSPKVATYDVKPEMSAKEITTKVIARLRKKPPELTVVNYANPDMVGHTGNLKATIHAVEVVDQCLRELHDATVAAGATLIVTADHGNAEQMINPETQEIDKEHTTNPVPFFLIDPALAYTDAKVDPAVVAAFAAEPPRGVLADVAPTVLDLLELSAPSQMTGQSLRKAL